jgi:hypothetical protein
MLITNFAAGELAETLFGRTDLGQYYSGVSRLENFDVIPTGGISRRQGMKRIAVKDSEGHPVEIGEGRIVPFIVDREHSFLLFFAPGSISILDGDGVVLDRKESVIYPVSYEVDNAFVPGEEGNTTLADIADPDDEAVAKVKADETQGGRPAKYQYHAGGEAWYPVADFLLYGTMADIHEVQYAQNFQTMVTVHRNYAPLLLELRGGKITVTVFVPGYAVIVEKGDELIDVTPFELDDTYAEKQYLQIGGEYPGAVTFFNGRLVFAATENSRQRIFASRVDDIRRFSTYKLFLTRQRNYIVIKGTIDDTNKRKITFDTSEGLKFSEAITNYRVDSPFFPTEKDGVKRDVRLEELKSNYIMVSEDSELVSGLTPEEENALAGIKSKWAAYNGNPLEFKIFDVSVRRDFSEFPVYSAYCKIYVDRMEMWVDVGGGIVPRHTASLSSDAAKTETQPHLLSFFNAQVEYFKALLRMIVPDVSSIYGDVNPVLANSYCGQWLGRITDSMMLVVDSGKMPLYGRPDDIQIQVDNMVDGWRDTYIALYTEHVIEDRHPSPDDGFTFEIASDMSDAIKWLGQNKNLLVGTETAEWVIPAATNAVNIQAILNSRYGSDSVQATAVGDAMCFFQTGKKALVEYYIPRQDNNFRANNMAMLSKNMLHESPAFDFDFISAPYTKLFVSREDGIVVCLLYERSTGTFAWGRIATNGLVKSVATIPGQSGYDDVYLLVKRGGDFFLETHSERVREHVEGDEEVFLDSYRKWDGDASGYRDDAVVYDETDNKTYPLAKEPVPGHVMWVGYPYESRVRSMPVLANDRMKQNNIKNLLIRFNDSFMPKARSVYMEAGKERTGNTDTIGRPEPYSGIVRIPFPGVWDRDVFFELVHDRPTRCRILAVNAEVN